MKRTKNCVFCGNNATIWTGHVHLPDNVYSIMFAGFCDNHVGIAEKLTSIDKSKYYLCEACFGDWKEEMGEENCVH